MKLGRSDDVMPYSQNDGVFRREFFERSHGHFTVPILMVRNARAFARLAEILHRL